MNAEYSFISFAIAADDARLQEYLPNVENAEDGNFLITVEFEEIDLEIDLSSQCEIIALQFSFDDVFQSPNILNFEDLDLRFFEDEIKNAIDNHLIDIVDTYGDFY